MREHFQTNGNTLAEENPSETISPMAATTIANNTTYTFKNVGTGRMLNLWGGLTTNATNVCQYSADGSNEQKWTRRGSKLYTNTSTSKCLDRYVGGGGAYNNADIYDDNDDENQNLEFVWRSGYVAVRLAGTSYYLTASSNAGTDSLMNSSGNTSAYKAPDAAGNVFWKFVSSTASLNNYNLWEANQVASGGSLTQDYKISSSRYTYICQQTYGWTNGNYGISTSNFQQTGCAAVAATMFSQIMQNNRAIVPEDLFAWGVIGNNGGYPYANWTQNSSSPLSFTFYKASSDWSTAKGIIYDQILADRPIIIWVTDATKNSGTHFVVAYGLKAGTTKSNITTSMIYVLDPWTAVNKTLADTMNFRTSWNTFGNIRIAQNK